MTLNKLPAQNSATTPRGIVRINGAPLPGWIEFSVDNNTHRQADTWRVSYACGLLPKAQNAAWLSAQTRMEVEIFAGYPTNPNQFSVSDLTSLVLGYCDRQDFDPERNVIEMSGRDLTSEMIDAKAGEKFVNQKASAIVKTIAARHGWTTDIDDTSALDGTYFEVDHARLRNAATEWDLLCELADDYGYDVWMTGKTLHFKVQDSANTGIYMIKWTPPSANLGYPLANAKTLKFSRDHMLARAKITVKVNSWNLKNKQKFTGTTTATKSAGAGSKSLTYTYNMPGLTQAQVNGIAKAKLKGIIRNEMCLRASMPADNVLTTRALVQVSGTGTAYDQTYWPVSVSRRMSFDGGYTMDLDAKNHAQESVSDSN